MKKNVLIIAILAVLMLTGCNNTEKIEDNNNQEHQENHQEDVININLNKSFEK